MYCAAPSEPDVGIAGVSSAGAADSPDLDRTAWDEAVKAGVEDPARLAALEKTGLLDSPPEEAFDRFAQLAARLAGAPAAAVVFIAKDRQFFKSLVGSPQPVLRDRSNPLSHSLCRHVIALRQPLVVGDARTHRLVCDNPVVEHGIIAYIGIPLILPQGEVIGSLCVVDIRPRDWQAGEVEALSKLAAMAMTEIALLGDIAERKRTEEALRESEERFSGAFEHAPSGVGLLSPEGRWLEVNHALCEMIGYSPAEFLAHRFGDFAHPDDLPACREQMRQLLSGEMSSCRNEKRYVHRLGHIVPVLFSLSLVRDSRGRPSYLIVQVQDITELRQADRALRKEQELLTALLDNATDGIVACDGDGVLTRFNRATREWQHTPVEPVPAHAWAEHFGLYRPDGVTPMATEEIPLFRALHEGTVRDAEMVIKRKDRPARRVLASGQAFADAKGVKLGAVVAMHDITERKRAEQEIALNEQRYRSLVEATAAIVWDMPASGQFEGEQPQWSAFTGQSFAELRGWGWLKAIHPDDQTATAEAWSSAVANRSTFEVEHRLRAHDGNYRNMMVRAVPILVEDGAIRQWVGVHTDITARKREEEDLRWKTAFLEAQVNSAAEGIVVLDPQGRRIIQNQRMAELLKIPRHLTEGPDCSKQRAWVHSLAKHPAQVIAKVNDVNAHPHNVIREELEYRDGSVFDCYSAPVIGKDGKYYGRIWTFLDITERKKDEARLLELNRELIGLSREAGMAEIATSVLHNVGNVLNSANISLEVAAAKMRALSTAGLGRVADLLRAHAPDLPGFLGLHPQGRQLGAYLGELAQHIDSEQAAALGEIKALRRHFDHISEIVARQQRHAAGVGGIKEISPINEIVDDALCMDDASQNENACRIVRDFSPDIPPLPLDRHKIVQILVNLFRNARHALSDAHRSDPCLTVRTQLAGPTRLSISVADNGSGISPPHLARIFEHGFTTKPAGHGFCLHSCAIAAQEMGGSLQVESAGAGQGALFTLEIPVGTESL